MRSLFALFTTAACLVLFAAAPASAVTYPAITISVPVTVSLPLTASQHAIWGTSQINVACVPGGAAAGPANGARYFGAVPTSYTNGVLAYSGPNIQVQVAAGLQSGAAMTCTVIASAGPAALAVFNSLNIDMTKAVTQIVLP